jgi:hypothetical protein
MHLDMDFNIADCDLELLELFSMKSFTIKCSFDINFDKREGIRIIILFQLLDIDRFIVIFKFPQLSVHRTDRVFVCVFAFVYPRHRKETIWASIVYFIT